jgi:hypothetical protein
MRKRLDQCMSKGELKEGAWRNVLREKKKSALNVRIRLFLRFVAALKKKSVPVF